MKPQIMKLSANQPPERFYRGGERIAAFRSTGNIQSFESSSLRVPEDWVASTTTLFGEETLGLSLTPSGDLLRNAIREDPLGWLGKNHVNRFGNDTALLVKLLDAGERLPVHFHPTQEFSAAHLGLAHGKTESWIALSPGEVALGFTRDITEAELRLWVEKQNTDAMLGAMHRLALQPGDAVLVPAGLPHAIGRGCFVIELQEPTDLSIMAEWRGFAFDGPRDGHLGLGFDIALQAVNRQGLPTATVERLRSGTATTRGPLLPGGAPFFQADRLGAGQSWEAGFSVVIVTVGDGSLITGTGNHVPVKAGETLVIPFAVGDLVVEGNLEVIVCRPPHAD